MCFVVIQLKWTPENIQLWWEKFWNKNNKTENLNENFDVNKKKDDDDQKSS